MELSLPRRKQILYAVIAVLIAIVFLFPVYWLVQLSFKPDMEAFGKVLTYYPHTFTFGPWQENLNDPVFMTSLKNSFINAFLTHFIRNHYHQARFPFEIPHYLRYTIFGRDAQQHMNMIWAGFCFQNFHFFLFTQLSQNFSYVFTYLPIYCKSPIFRRKYYMVLTSPPRML